ncbi:MAG: hypothetical protein LBS68_00945, partial [Puniceicoccales bacterium]|nr:hypothetical protein [Puniceicoccales bacterium]
MIGSLPNEFRGAVFGQNSTLSSKEDDDDVRAALAFGAPNVSNENGTAVAEASAVGNQILGGDINKLRVKCGLKFEANLQWLPEVTDSAKLGNCAIVSENKTEDALHAPLADVGRDSVSIVQNCICYLNYNEQHDTEGNPEAKYGRIKAANAYHIRGNSNGGFTLYLIAKYSHYKILSDFSESITRKNKVIKCECKNLKDVGKAILMIGTKTEALYEGGKIDEDGIKWNDASDEFGGGQDTMGIQDAIGIAVADPMAAVVLQATALDVIHALDKEIELLPQNQKKEAIILNLKVNRLCIYLAATERAMGAYNGSKYIKSSDIVFFQKILDNITALYSSNLGKFHGLERLEKDIENLIKQFDAMRGKIAPSVESPIELDCPCNSPYLFSDTSYTSTHNIDSADQLKCSTNKEICTAINTFKEQAHADAIDPEAAIASLNALAAKALGGQGVAAPNKPAAHLAFGAIVSGVTEGLGRNLGIRTILQNKYNKPEEIAGFLSQCQLALKRMEKVAELAHKENGDHAFTINKFLEQNPQAANAFYVIQAYMLEAYRLTLETDGKRKDHVSDHLPRGTTIKQFADSLRLPVIPLGEDQPNASMACAKLRQDLLANFGDNGDPNCFILGSSMKAPTPVMQLLNEIEGKFNLRQFSKNGKADVISFSMISTMNILRAFNAECTDDELKKQHLAYHYVAKSIINYFFANPAPDRYTLPNASNYDEALSAVFNAAVRRHKTTNQKTCYLFAEQPRGATKEMFDPYYAVVELIKKCIIDGEIGSSGLEKKLTEIGISATRANQLISLLELSFRADAIIAQEAAKIPTNPECLVENLAGLAGFGEIDRLCKVTIPGQGTGIRRDAPWLSRSFAEKTSRSDALLFAENLKEPDENLQTALVCRKENAKKRKDSLGKEWGHEEEALVDPDAAAALVARNEKIVGSQMGTDPLHRLRQCYVTTGDVVSDILSVYSAIANIPDAITKAITDPKAKERGEVEECIVRLLMNQNIGDRLANLSMEEKKKFLVQCKTIFKDI